jgi:hypothetical protein
MALCGIYLGGSVVKIANYAGPGAATDDDNDDNDVDGSGTNVDVDAGGAAAAKAGGGDGNEGNGGVGVGGGSGGNDSGGGGSDDGGSSGVSAFIKRAGHYGSSGVRDDALSFAHNGGRFHVGSESVLVTFISFEFFALCARNFYDQNMQPYTHPTVPAFRNEAHRRRHSNDWRTETASKRNGHPRDGRRRIQSKQGATEFLPISSELFSLVLVSPFRVFFAVKMRRAQYNSRIIIFIHVQSFLFSICSAIVWASRW